MQNVKQFHSNEQLDVFHVLSLCLKIAQLKEIFIDVWCVEKKLALRT